MYHGKKLIIGPHIVVRGSQKNYAHFLNYNMSETPDSIYFEDLVAKAIFFKTAEKIYGVKPNSIGDMRYITVPYSVSWINYKTNNQVDLYKIWKTQGLSKEMEELIYQVMVQIDTYLNENAPGSLYGEWAKKEDCWAQIRQQDLDIDLELINQDLLKQEGKRKKISDDEIEDTELKFQLERIKAIPYTIWKKIEKWGYDAEGLTKHQQTLTFNIAGKVRRNVKISPIERQRAIEIIDIVIEKAPDLLFEIDNLDIAEDEAGKYEQEITIELVKKMVAWDKKNKKLKDHYYKYMLNVAEGRTSFNERTKSYVRNNLKYIERFGFKPE